MKALIRMNTCNPVDLTTEEYQQLKHEVRGRVIGNEAGVSDRILSRLLEEHALRYHEAKRQNEE